MMNSKKSIYPMNLDSLVSNSPVISAYIIIKSPLDLEELGRKIADRLLPGLSFGGKDDYVRDETPAIFIPDVLGCELILDGDTESGYTLALEPVKYYMEKGVFTPKAREVDLSGLFAYLLADLKEVEVEAAPPTLPA
jgi:hypothetical protein